MLVPNKYTNLNVSLLSITAELLMIFNKEDEIRYIDLLNKIIQAKGIEAKEMLLPSLNLLFLLGKIKYYKKGDLIEYIK